MSSLDPLAPLPEKWADPEYVQRQLAELEDCRKLAGERARRLHAIEDLHERVPDAAVANDRGADWCGECSTAWPCATIRLVQGEEI